MLPWTSPIARHREAAPRMIATHQGQSSPGLDHLGDEHRAESLT